MLLYFVNAIIVGGLVGYEDRKAEVVNQLHLIDNIRFLGSRLQFFGKQLKIVEIAKFIELNYLKRQNFH